MSSLPVVVAVVVVVVVVVHSHPASVISFMVHLVRASPNVYLHNS